MELTTTTMDQAVAMKATGRMDAVTAPAFEQECLRLREEGNTKVIVDLSGLEYISSAGLRVILGAGKALKKEGGILVFCGMSAMVKEVFEISGFSTIFSVHDTMEEALAAI